MSNDIIPIGYKAPPQHTRFKKGQSGNPRGRPKGTGKPSKNLVQHLMAILNETVVIHDQSGPKNITIQEALIYGQIKKAMSGDSKAFLQIMSMLPPEATKAPPPQITVRFIGDD